MGPACPPRPFAAPCEPTPGDLQAWLEIARMLQHAALAGRAQPLMRGKNLGLLCVDDTLPPALLFRRAAGELGAHVARINMGLSERSPALEVTHTARMLGRLYDAVECQGLAHALVLQLAEGSGITVYDGLAGNDALLTPLALQLGPQASLVDNRRFALQALLLHTIV